MQKWREESSLSCSCCCHRSSHALHRHRGLLTTSSPHIASSISISIVDIHRRPSLRPLSFVYRRHLALMPIRHQLVVVLVMVACSSLVTNVTAELHARIESCSGWALNKLPILKSFLKDGEAESYQNVHVVYIPGKKAIMTIYEGDDSSMDGWENRMEVKETIVLSDYANKVWFCDEHWLAFTGSQQIYL